MLRFCFCVSFINNINFQTKGKANVMVEIELVSLILLISTISQILLRYFFTGKFTDPYERSESYKRALIIFSLIFLLFIGSFLVLYYFDKIFFSFKWLLIFFFSIVTFFHIYFERKYRGIKEEYMISVSSLIIFLILVFIVL